MQQLFECVGFMRVVDDHGGPAVRRDGFEAPAHGLQVADARFDLILRDGEDDGRADRGHPVVEIRLAKHVGIDADVAGRRVQRTVQAARAGLKVRPDVALATEGHPAADLAQQPPAVLVVRVDHRAIGAGDLREEDLLRLEVVLEVLVKVEVVLREVGEYGGGEADAVRALQCQGV